jgi:hypothetical protein
MTMPNGVINVRVCVECFADEAFVKALGSEKPAHPRTKTRVVRYVRSHRNVIGLIDEDPGAARPPGLREYDTIQEKNDLLLMEWREKRIVIIRPKLEDWILATAWAQDIDVRDPKYGLPDDPDALKKVINGRLDSIPVLLDDLMTSPRINTLKQFLSID